MLLLSILWRRQSQWKRNIRKYGKKRKKPFWKSYDFHYKTKEFRKIGDVAGEELLEKEVISKYESLYLALQSENFDTFSEEQWNMMENTLEEIRKNIKSAENIYGKTKS